MDTLEKLRRLAWDQKHPGQECKPGEHWDAEDHHCVKMTPQEAIEDKKKDRTK